MHRYRSLSFLREGSNMTDTQKKLIVGMRTSGQGYKQIAETLGISANTIKSYCQRSGLTGGKVSNDDHIIEKKDTCKQCGAALAQRPNIKSKTFCSNECRIRWWSKNRNQSAGASTVAKCCAHCGLVFQSQVSAKRKYCCLACFIAAHQRKGDQHVTGAV